MYIRYSASGVPSAATGCVVSGRLGWLAEVWSHLDRYVYICAYMGIWVYTVYMKCVCIVKVFRYN